MKKAKIIAGIVWGLVCLVLILLLFPGLNSYSGSVAKLPFMKINANYTGGEVACKVIKENYTIDIRKPVFDGLIKEKKNGFVQVDWRGNIPDEIIDTIDYDHDNKPDFRVLITKSTGKSEISSFDHRAGKILVSSPTSYGWAIRVELHR